MGIKRTGISKMSMFGLTEELIIQTKGSIKAMPKMIKTACLMRERKRCNSR